MAIKENYNKNAVENAFATVLVNTATTTVGNVIAVADFELGVTFAITGGIVTAGAIIPLLEESDTSGGTYTAVADIDLYRADGDTGQEVLATIDTTDQVEKLGYLGIKAFVRLSLVSDGTTNLTVGANVIKEGELQPVA